MATASASVRIPVSADTVWALVGGFLSLPDWLPFIAQSVSDEGGRIRHLTTEDGAKISERLETYDNQARTYSYSITEGPLPVTGYLATLKVRADGERAAVVQWSSIFTANGVSDAEAEALIQGVYDSGLEALKGKF
ncbi:Polyketide cyclase / dehydrase and lipid transport [Pseudomonas sp. NFACC02]|uniref:SRPBCC family protein n=1 Tax=Pseudomonas sp. NFACC02 TaxID=1566250 RepID=UPI0008AF3286|nr:SRPBCC family protein [Pseudomonas sp. NFACC02]SEP67462.1 Polyketide cyclase / dehydrase and lipid transport [Pseudomonas sp. NFACC02]